MKNNSLLILAFSSLVFLTACSNGTDEVDPVLFGTNHYPIQSGQYVTYQMERVIYNELEDDIFETFQRKEVVVDTFFTVNNQLAYRIEQFTRNSDSEPWIIDSVWTLRKERSRLIKVENNESFVKLVFPTEDGMTWNGNVLNDFGIEEYQAEVLQSYQLNGESFPNVIRVLHNQDSSLVDRDVRVEVYAENIGMIYKKTEVFQYISDFTNPFYGQDSISTGLSVKQTAIDWGIE